jgi:aldose 1-epimerase
VKREPFGTVAGRPVERYTLTNSNGIEVAAITYGGIITSITAPDRAGRFDDIVLGFDTLDGYLGDHPYFGALVGRYCNRIAHGRFVIGAHEYRLAINNGPHHLHGGSQGFDKRIWSAATGGPNAVRFSYISEDGEEGYPGTLRVAVTYTLTDRDELQIDYRATTDQATHVNLTQHTYFNLAGDGDALGHELMIAADSYTPVDATLIPTGEIAPVEGTPFDFRNLTPIGARIDAAHPQLAHGHGYDHNWVLNGDGAAAFVREPRSGRTLEVVTTEPGMQVYTGNFLDGTLSGKGGRAYGKRTGFCLETQHFPDTPNQAAFPSTLLAPGKEYVSMTRFVFGMNK